MCCYLRRSWFLLVCVLLCCGCNPARPPVAKVHGQVRLNGEPLTSGIVILESEDGQQSQLADLDAQGKFEVRTYQDAGIPPGIYKIAVQPGRPTGDEMPLVSDVTKPAPPPSPIPMKYFSVATSGLTWDIKLDQDNDLQIDLKP
ncbi:hypothetical protein ETAA8_24670 [Anatilimnocola aggregata]|uniref:Carboxypeptidase regulatory-like domain-containing protein n=1 Tax=Anatilimnocola aggregata TaxID=2528021 RepID=A0A517YAW8_9BACT|nr:hypothetical protein [Anatilimnocola aggregata]QDU27380.1 hypothetical protein ETAA8_24670 [Anatilimnocola aggregata]